MTDLAFDIDAQDMVMTNGDFTSTDSPSVQNGGIILLARAFNVNNLILGINVNQIRAAKVTQANYEMNRWKQQVISDGGQATVTSISDGEGDTDFDWQVKYQ